MKAKSKIKIEKEVQETEEFPILKEYCGDDSKGKFVVLFDSLRNGTVVFSENKTYQVGNSSINWIDFNDVKYWKTFNGIIKLFNK